MAEAIVEDIPPPHQKFYCHLCNVEVHSVNSDFTCPICSGGFIEEIQDSNNEPASEDVEMHDGVNYRVDDLDMIRDEITNLLIPLGTGFMNGSATGSSSSGSGGGSGVSGVASSSTGVRPMTIDALVDAHTASGSEPRRSNTRSRHFRMQNMNRFDNILLEVLQTLSGGGSNETLGNGPMFFMGNPGDYAWGREGIDSIVTQLLNQMDTTGPPPLAKDKIEKIPLADITQEQVDIKLQCSVCWEDFIINEVVRKLPCLHVYHNNCIIPWLELHGTCPICRKSLSPDASGNIAASMFDDNEIENMPPPPPPSEPSEQRQSQDENNLYELRNPYVRQGRTISSYFLGYPHQDGRPIIEVENVIPTPRSIVVHSATSPYFIVSREIIQPSSQEQQAQPATNEEPNNVNLNRTNLTSTTISSNPDVVCTTTSSQNCMSNNETIVNNHNNDITNRQQQSAFTATEGSNTITTPSTNISTTLDIDTNDTNTSPTSFRVESSSRNQNNSLNNEEGGGNIDFEFD